MYPRLDEKIDLIWQPRNSPISFSFDLITLIIFGEAWVNMTWIYIVVSITSEAVFLILAKGGRDTGVIIWL